MSRNIATKLGWGLFLLMLHLAFPVSAEEAAASDQPFADTKVVLQISDDAPDKQTLVLNAASNLLKHYGQDKVSLEIVAFGPGLKVLLADNENKERVDSLSASGVRFSACENSIAGLAKKLGKEPELNAHAARVPAGVVRIIELAGQGYVLIRP